MWNFIYKNLVLLLKELMRGYAWITLLPTWQAGVVLLLLTFIKPWIGAIGLLGATCAWLAGHIAGADANERPVCVFNGILCSLFVANTWMFGTSVIALAVLTSIFSGWLTVAYGHLTWKQLELPILSLPFSLVAMLTVATGNSFSTLTFNPYIAPPSLFGNQIDQFFSAFGMLYFMPTPFIGLLIVLVILINSRYFIILALLGYYASWLWLKSLGAAPEHLANTAWDCNAILASILVGGLFAKPSWRTAALAVLAAIIASWLALALGRILDVIHLFPFSAPFVFAAWIVLYAAVRNTHMTGSFNIPAPNFPEHTYERAKLGLARIGHPTSVAFGLPFADTWTVSQGFSGKYTHRGPWRYALDFIIMKDGKSFAHNGTKVEDFYCYNQPVLAPVYGQVWRVVNEIPDNKPGTVNVAANWGNHILIRIHDGRFALVAHLKPWSIIPLAGAWIKPGDLIGYCGNSGRSPQPHIHMHLQISEELGAPTAPFHLTSVLLTQDSKPEHYELAVVPKESATLLQAVAGEVRPIYLLAGRGLRYAVAVNEQIHPDWSIHCAVDNLGRLTLNSNSDAHCIAESTWAVFSCYERSGNPDPFFDIWLLACAYTPASFQIKFWQDQAIPARLLPSNIARGLAKIIWPWMTFITSEYQRYWDAEMQGWRQKVQHRQPLSGINLQIEALILPQVGCTYISAEINNLRYTMQATSSFQQADLGVPAWEMAINISDKPRQATRALHEK
ncbi:hypothetical protein TI05_02020 [Achromatium sp. WMS3]|nr:hypothetical protein TI05_02020 [Achromatium sp. WMS3]